MILISTWPTNGKMRQESKRKLPIKPTINPEFFRTHDCIILGLWMD